MKEPKEITIPFLERFRRDIVTGQKIMTTRTKKYGEVGDYFWVDDGSYRTKIVLLAVFRIRLFHVAYHFYRAEGLRTPEDFITVWNQIHPKRNYVVDEQNNFFVHVFSPATDWAGYAPEILLSVGEASR